MATTTGTLDTCKSRLRTPTVGGLCRSVGLALSTTATVRATHGNSLSTAWITTASRSLDVGAGTDIASAQLMETGARVHRRRAGRADGTWAAGSPRPAPEPSTRVYELLTLRTAVRRVRLHGLRHTFATLQSVGGGAFQAVVKVVGAQQLCAHTKHLRGLHPRRRYGGAGVGSPGCRAGNQRGGPRAEKERHHAHAVAALGAGLVPRHANGRPPNQDGMYTAKSPPMGPDRQGGLAVET